MALYKLEEFDQDYREGLGGNDIKGMSVYSEVDEKIGTVSDVLVDDQGHFRYLVLDLGFWIFGKKVLLPVGRTRIDANADRIYAVGMTREQADNLPEFNENTALDYDYEERVRGSYRSPAVGTSVSSVTDAVTPVDTSYSTTTGTTANQPISATRPAAYDRNTYNYRQDASLYDMNERDHQTLRLYEERVIANKTRRKTGEVAVGKHVETETQRVSVPIEKERVVIERVTPADAGRPVTPGEATFREGEVAHVEIYEETPDIHKEAVLREEVRIRKEVDRETVEAQETIRREELDIDTEGRTIEDRSGRLPNDRI